MTRRGNSRGNNYGPALRVRQIALLDSFTVGTATETFLPAGARILHVKSESDGRDTSVFTVNTYVYATGTLYENSTKHSGAPNGMGVPITAHPLVTNVGTTPAATGEVGISVRTDTSTTATVYYRPSGVPQ